MHILVCRILSLGLDVSRFWLLALSYFISWYGFCVTTLLAWLRDPQSARVSTKLIDGGHHKALIADEIFWLRRLTIFKILNLRVRCFLSLVEYLEFGLIWIFRLFFSLTDSRGIVRILWTLGNCFLVSSAVTCLRLELSTVDFESLHSLPRLIPPPLVYLSLSHARPFGNLNYLFSRPQEITASQFTLEYR